MKVERIDYDSAIRTVWADQPIPPIVFIIGLHRSGTTFLYETLSQVFPISKLTLQHVVTYRKLITNHLGDSGVADGESLSDYLQQRQANVRGRDALPLNPQTAEEYGWILKSESGSYATTEKSLPVIRDIVSKLRFLEPDRMGVLLKNPWDTNRVTLLSRHFPNARFIFLRRDPLEILNSELGNLLHFTGKKDALIELLSRDIGSTRALLNIARLLRLVMGTQLFSKLCIRLMAKDVLRNVNNLIVSQAEIDGAQSLEISYDQLVNQLHSTLELIAAFTGFPLDEDAATRLRPQKRTGGFFPLIASQEETLRSFFKTGRAPESGSA